MGLLDAFMTTSKVVSKETYNFMVIAALQEELNEFYNVNQSFSKRTPKEGGAYEVSYTASGETVNILTYTPNKMGMPFNAAAIMNILSIHEPIYTIMIGTCACIGKTHNLGDVLIPDRVFSYESGKYENGIFKPDFAAYSTGEDLRKQAEYLKSKIKNKLNFKVTTDEDFCSGGAVIDDKELCQEIISRCGRKLSGLDMEAYSVACINNILKGDKELLVVKGISDFAKEKSDTESKGNKELAKKNSARYAYELIKHLQDSFFSQKQPVKIKTR